jgi:hypothetical protein
MDEKICTSCGCKTTMHHYLEHVCYNCYEDMFKDIPVKESESVEEPDFEIKSDVATVKNCTINNNLLYVKNGDKLIRVRNPKRMVFNPDARVKDYEKLVLFLLENMVIYDDAKGFDKVSWMFKEADKE